MEDAYKANGAQVMPLNPYGSTATLQTIVAERKNDMKVVSNIENYALNQQARSQRVATATADIPASVGVVLVDYTATGACTVTLPAPDAVKNRIITVKDSGGSATTNNITIDAGATTVDAGATTVINVSYMSLTLYCDGVEYWII